MSAAQGLRESACATNFQDPAAGQGQKVLKLPEEQMKPRSSSQPAGYAGLRSMTACGVCQPVEYDSQRASSAVIRHLAHRPECPPDRRVGAPMR